MKKKIEKALIALFEGSTPTYAEVQQAAFDIAYNIMREPISNATAMEITNNVNVHVTFNMPAGEKYTGCEE